MKSVYITTVFGPDSPGLIKSLATVTRGLGGEWLTSKAMKIDGQFTAMMKVTIEKEIETKLKAELQENFKDLTFAYSEAETGKDKPLETINLSVDCKDRPGLTKDINGIISNQNLKVESMEFNRYEVTGLGEAVFSAKLAISVSEGTNKELVAEYFEALPDDVRVNIT